MQRIDWLCIALLIRICFNDYVEIFITFGLTFEKGYLEFMLVFYMFNSILDCIDTICLYAFESLEYYYYNYIL